MIGRLFCCLGFFVGSCPAVEVVSPNGDLRLDVSVNDAGALVYHVDWKGKPVIVPSGMGFMLADGEDWSAGFDAEVERSITQTIGSWKPVWGERERILDTYHGATVRFGKRVGAGELAVEMRAYNEGVAFRYVLDSVGSRTRLKIEREQTEFRMVADHDVWAVTSAQGKYSKVKMSAMPSTVERPCVLEAGGGPLIAIAEAALVDYSRMRLGPLADAQHALVSKLHGPVEVELPLKTPWRVIMIADQAGELLENNHLLLNLNEPSKLEKTDWIKPGKVIRDVSLSTEGGMACVDFAVDYGLQYVEFDAGWYGDERDEDSDATTVSKRGLDLPKVIAHAKERGIGVLLYVNRRHLERDLDALLPLYKSWGIAGLKFGFVQHGSQKWTRWMHEAIVRAAEYELMVDVHDEYRMTGWQRTYPNFMTAEGIGGDETRPSNVQALANLFTRMIAAPADHTFCYYNRYVDETTSHAAQLAKMVCFFSPWQFVFWYDRPQRMERGPELGFIKDLPTTWNETRVLRGEIGKFAVVARRHGNDWFVGCLNAGQARTLDVSLDFLPSTGVFAAEIYRDDPEMDTVAKVSIEKREVTSNDSLSAGMSGQGGVAIRITPIR
ncbi:glycoside hydrolase family 97 protein [Verrucomicrobiales bacterium]|jgi:alpha-glucosidase|nr:glycoside hydrolase family 97 protein [Verrucomicrobiales bacterium]MDB2346587.1 glycoside hydrolase family 97 protein [Verrucomicrobiales bacterium]MDC0504321.1 glycoside hydrolase family 97 protein [Verrucomicrobiales bacterium]